MDKTAKELNKLSNILKAIDKYTDNRYEFLTTIFNRDVEKTIYMIRDIKVIDDIEIALGIIVYPKKKIDYKLYIHTNKSFVSINEFKKVMLIIEDLNNKINNRLLAKFELEDSYEKITII